MTRVVFALERNAKTDPPEGSGEYLPTDVGLLLYDANRQSWGEWVEVTDEFFPALPQPSVWYDLRPTDGEGLTTEDLRVLADARIDDDGEDAVAKSRLRAALVALTKEDS